MTDTRKDPLSEQSVVERIVYVCEGGHRIRFSSERDPDWRCACPVAKEGENEPCGAPVYEVTLREASRRRMGTDLVRQRRELIDAAASVATLPEPRSGVRGESVEGEVL